MIFRRLIFLIHHSEGLLSPCTSHTRRTRDKSGDEMRDAGGKHHVLGIHEAHRSHLTGASGFPCSCSWVRFPNSRPNLKCLRGWSPVWPKLFSREGLAGRCLLRVETVGLTSPLTTGRPFMRPPWLSVAVEQRDSVLPMFFTRSRDLSRLVGDHVHPRHPVPRFGPVPALWAFSSFAAGSADHD